MSICKKHQAIPCLCNDTDKVIVLVTQLDNDFKICEKLKELNLNKLNLKGGTD